MEPTWVRPSYLYLICLLGITLMAFGALGVIMGAVHVAAPSLQQQADPITRFADAAINVATSTFGNEQSDVTDALAKAKTELRAQARKAGTNEAARGAVLFVIGSAIWAYHWRKVDRPAQTWAQPGA